VHGGGGDNFTVIASTIVAGLNSELNTPPPALQIYFTRGTQILLTFDQRNVFE
jgi:hypothetical protein